MSDEEQEPSWLKAMRPSFAVNDRVRVRLNGECRVYLPRRGKWGHPLKIDRETGYIIDIYPWPDRPQHAYGVVFDRIIVDDDYGFNQQGEWLCAEELEPDGPAIGQPAHGQGE